VSAYGTGFWCVVGFMALGACADHRDKVAAAERAALPPIVAAPYVPPPVAPQAYYAAGGYEEPSGCDDYCREDQAEALMQGGMSAEQAADELDGAW
jgi:hypothetical protein